MLGRTLILGIVSSFMLLGLTLDSNITHEMQTFASNSGGQIDQIPSEPTDFPGSDASAVKVDVTTANKDSTGSYHVRGAIKNLGDVSLEFVKVTGLFYDKDNQTVGITSCCYADPHTIEPGRTATFDSFAQEDEISGTPTSFRLSFDWNQ